MYTEDAPKTNQLKGYVEDELVTDVVDYAKANGLTKSQAVRRLVIEGLGLEVRRARVLRDAELGTLGDFNQPLSA